MSTAPSPAPRSAPGRSVADSSAPVRRPCRRSARWDRLAVLGLGGAASALSFDALRQIAVAIHIIPSLSYLFPIVIDGFIAYGVRAILILHDAPWRSRAYAWALFGAATTASLWANSLHAVRLNQPGVHTIVLDDRTVAILSYIAPLALGGATHLHVLINRYTGTATSPAGGRAAETRPHDVDEAGSTSGAPAGILVSEPRLPPVRPATEAPATARKAPSQAAAGTDATANAPADIQFISTGTHEAAVPEPTAGQTSARQHPDELEVPAGQSTGTDPGTGLAPARAGRPAAVTDEELAHAIVDAYPDGQPVARPMARMVVSRLGIPAGNTRLDGILRHLNTVRDQQRQPHQN